MTQHHYLAPGVLDGPHRAPRRGLSLARAARIGRALLMLAGLAALSAVLGFAAGYLQAPSAVSPAPQSIHQSNPKVVS